MCYVGGMDCQPRAIQNYDLTNHQNAQLVRPFAKTKGHYLEPCQKGDFGNFCQMPRVGFLVRDQPDDYHSSLGEHVVRKEIPFQSRVRVSCAQHKPQCQWDSLTTLSEE